jgi:hypothetical protein
MSTRSGAAVFILVTLVIGVLIGALLVGPLVARHHFSNLEKLRTREGFAARMEQDIRPDASQVGPIRDVLTKYSSRFEAINAQYHVAMAALADSLHQDLDPLLTAEQKARLEEGRKHAGRRLPPPGGPPPEQGPGPK